MQKSQMAKKKSKQQPKQPNVANVSHTATAQTTSQLASTPHEMTHMHQQRHKSHFLILLPWQIQRMLKYFSSSQAQRQREKTSRTYGDGYMEKATKRGEKQYWRICKKNGQ